MFILHRDGGGILNAVDSVQHAEPNGVVVIKLPLSKPEAIAWRKQVVSSLMGLFCSLEEPLCKYLVSRINFSFNLNSNIVASLALCQEAIKYEDEEPSLSSSDSKISPLSFIYIRAFKICIQMGKYIFL